jgi:hypothetical protein
MERDFSEKDERNPSVEVKYEALTPVEKVEINLDIIDEKIRRRDLSRLTEMDVVPFSDAELPELEEDVISNIRLFKINEMVYQKGESATNKFTTVYNALQTYNATVFVLMDSDGDKTDFYLGVRSNGDTRSTVTLGDTLKDTLVGNFPGVKVTAQDRQSISTVAQDFLNQENITSVSVVGNSKDDQQMENDKFVQGLEKLSLAMVGRKYTGVIVAQNMNSASIQLLRKQYQELYTQLSPYQKIQFSENSSTSTSRAKSFAEMSGKQKAAMIGASVAGVAGSLLGFGLLGGLKEQIQPGNGSTGSNGGNGYVGAMLGGQMGQSIGGLIQSLAPNEQLSDSSGTSETRTTENKGITDMLRLLDEQLKRMDSFDSYGMWNVAGYFSSDDMATAEIAASNYRSLMNGEESGREVSAINSWHEGANGFTDLQKYLSRFVHPQFVYGGQYLTNAATAVSGKELGIHLGLPRKTVPGLAVIEHAEFGKEVNTYRLFDKHESDSVRDKVTLGRIFDLGRVTDKKVELKNQSLDMHTFITGSTGSGKSNTVYQLLNELRQDGIPFLVVEPAKGEYKDVFGHLPDVNVFSTNPKVAQLIKINPFKFPESVHVLEHIDGLVEILSVVWPMYDAMSAFLKEAITKSYELIGWDLGSSTFTKENVIYPDFQILVKSLEELIEKSDYSAEVKGNYTGALVTRVRSLTVGLNRFIFSDEQTDYDVLFDESAIVDLSRVKSSETKALIMGLLVYILNEYRSDQKQSNNEALKHVTVLEEAHNLLKNTTSGDSELIGKSVEMITNTIAEIRTYGEGFIIVDQSPSSVDIAAIKNTNTKIILRTPEANDREAVGRSMGLTTEQVNEIAKLPSGVAAVYQNDWIEPVLTLVDKASVTEVPYQPDSVETIKPLRLARTQVITGLMSAWFEREEIPKAEWQSSLTSLNISQLNRSWIKVLLEQYSEMHGALSIKVEQLPVLQGFLFDILDLSGEQMSGYVSNQDAEGLLAFIQQQTEGLSEQELIEIASLLTYEEEDDGL